MDASNLYVQLKVSFYKLLIQIGLLAILFVLALQTMPSIWALLLTVVAGFFSLFFRNRSPITAMAHLDQNTWTLAKNSLKNSQVVKSNLQQQAELKSIQSFGILLFFQFENKDEKPIHLWIAKDQVSLVDWKKLKQLQLLN
ncbi:hypothetical protein MKI79_00630 [Acinetobacter sp. A3.8]|uniref:Uncharacterized protein n=1 Tax=Acinetobacter sedimenti TaxID=2919922 RepID=A0A9X1WX11_9GAMM|nr:protein YgfX [Acinetobacter sedimenti]MCJ8145437.1 hypothetical protein [Acinetobacter sedimenti]